MSEVAEELADVRRGFNDWRRQHGGPGKRLPEALWAAATMVARHKAHVMACGFGLGSAEGRRSSTSL